MLQHILAKGHLSPRRYRQSSHSRPQASIPRVMQKCITTQESLIICGLEVWEGMAERQGFEPWIPCGIHAFQACAFSHSAISPQLVQPFDSNTVETPSRPRYF